MQLMINSDHDFVFLEQLINVLNIMIIIAAIKILCINYMKTSVNYLGYYIHGRNSREYH